MRSVLLLAGAAAALVSPRTATLGLGCFWEPSEKLLKLDGVVDTRCGYQCGNQNFMAFSC